MKNKLTEIVGLPGVIVKDQKIFNHTLINESDRDLKDCPRDRMIVELALYL